MSELQISKALEKTRLRIGQIELGEFTRTLDDEAVINYFVNKAAKLGRIPGDWIAVCFEHLVDEEELADIRQGNVASTLEKILDREQQFCEKTTQEVFAFIENAYPELAEYLGVEAKKIRLAFIPEIVLDAERFTKGDLTGRRGGKFLPEENLVYAVTNTQFGRSKESYIRTAIHELVHALSLNERRGTIGFAQFSRKDQPDNLNEGATEFFTQSFILERYPDAGIPTSEEYEPYRKIIGAFLKVVGKDIFRNAFLREGAELLFRKLTEANKNGVVFNEKMVKSILAFCYGRLTDSQVEALIRGNEVAINLEAPGKLSSRDAGELEKLKKVFLNLKVEGRHTNIIKS